MFKRKPDSRGFSLVEVLIVASLSALIFGALFSTFQYSLQLIGNSRAKLSAQSVANDRMEYFRSLPYDDVGVIAGFPAGLIPQNSTTTMNGIEFVERVRVDYIDDDADGVAGADTNAITTDYKQIRLEYKWSIGNATSSIVLVSNIVPRSIETNVGGGTARINVLDADSSLLQGASVRLLGSSSTLPYDVTNNTDASGAATFAVPADSGYSVEVTANISGKQYSLDKTYEATTSNPNPTTAPFAVLEADVSTLTFKIGELSDLSVTSLSAVTEGSLIETFSNLASVASSTNVMTVGGDLVLEDVVGVYKNSGVVYLGPITPTPLEIWSSIRTAVDLPIDTSYKVQLFTGVGTGPYTLIPDSEFPGNAAGFTDSIIDISALDVFMFPSIFVGITLETSDTSVTPEVDEVGVYYRNSKALFASVPFDVRGDKVIGADIDSAPIYKFTDSITTNGSGNYLFTDLEFDDYTFENTSGYDIASACSEHPFNHQAGIDGELEIELVSGAVDTLRVVVTDGLGRKIPGATVNLQRPGYDVTIDTNNCGQAFFTGGVSANSDYVIDVSATGYSSQNIDPFDISGDEVTTVVLNP